MKRLWVTLARAACAPAALPLCALISIPLTPAQRAMINHFTNNDPAWTTLRDAVVAEDKAKGVLNASFSPQLRALDGKPFHISGYMTPIETDMRTAHFIVTRRDTTCPFCPPNTPTEAVEVRLTRPTPFTRTEVAVSGRLELVGSSDTGLFYRLVDAVMGPPPRPG